MGRLMVVSREKYFSFSMARLKNKSPEIFMNFKAFSW